MIICAVHKKGLNGYANKKSSGQHPRSLVRAFAVRSYRLRIFRKYRHCMNLLWDYIDSQIELSRYCWNKVLLMFEICHLIMLTGGQSSL